MPEESAIKELQKTLERIQQLGVVKINNSIVKIMGVSFLKGVAFGLGSLVGAGIVLSLLLYLLSQVEFIPVIGEWATQIINIVEKNQG